MLAVAHSRRHARQSIGLRTIGLPTSSSGHVCSDALRHPFSRDGGENSVPSDNMSPIEIRLPLYFHCMEKIRFRVNALYIGAEIVESLLSIWRVSAKIDRISCLLSAKSRSFRKNQ